MTIKQLQDQYRQTLKQRPSSEYITDEIEIELNKINKQLESIRTEMQSLETPVEIAIALAYHEYTALFFRSGFSGTEKECLIEAVRRSNLPTPIWGLLFMSNYSPFDLEEWADSVLAGTFEGKIEDDSHN